MSEEPQVTSQMHQVSRGSEAKPVSRSPELAEGKGVYDVRVQNGPEKAGLRFLLPMV
jgi:hypothetical protein